MTRRGRTILTVSVIVAWSVIVLVLRSLISSSAAILGVWIGGVGVLLTVIWDILGHIRRRIPPHVKPPSRRSCFEPLLLWVPLIAYFLTLTILVVHGPARELFTATGMNPTQTVWIRISLAVIGAGVLLMLWAKILITRGLSSQITYVGQRIGYCTRASMRFSEDILTMPILRDRWSMLLHACVHVTSRFFLTSVRDVFLRDQGPRSAWLLIPDHGDKHFDVAAFCCPPERPEWEPVFSHLAENHRPPFYDDNAFVRLCYESGPDLTLDEEFQERRRTITSGAGYVFHTCKAGVHNNISHCPYFDNSYLEHVPPDKRERIRFRSLVAIPLPYKNRVVGVLMVFTSGKANPFFSPDLEILKVIAIFLGSSIGYGIRSSVLPEAIFEEAPAFQEFPY